MKGIVDMTHTMLRWIAMLDRAYGVRLYSVGRFVSNDNALTAHVAIILPCVTIEPDDIVAAGAVVTRDVAPDDIAGGIPARLISKVNDLVRRLQDETGNFPRADVIRNRQALVQQRVTYFYQGR